MSEIRMELLERYLAGKASTEECQRVDAWLAEDPRRWAELTALRDALEKAELSDRAAEEAMAEVWARLAPEIGAGEQPPARVGRRAPHEAREFTLPARKPLVALVAALVVLMIGGGVAATLLLRGPSAPAEALRVATTAPGERAAFRLPDGTQVMLGVASSLRYPRVFPSGTRDVSLEGEAYFDVAHEEKRPFIVRAGDLVAKDLGTQFTVRAYPDDPGARVVVREGRVAIRAAADDGAEGVVAPGHLGRLATGGMPVVERADTAVHFSWTQGRLVFDRTPLREALPQLGRWFDLEFRLADSSLADVPLTAVLKAQATPDVLDNLAGSLGMQQRRQGRIVILYSADLTR